MRRTFRWSVLVRYHLKSSSGVVAMVEVEEVAVIMRRNVNGLAIITSRVTMMEALVMSQ